MADSRPRFFRRPRKKADHPAGQQTEEASSHGSGAPPAQQQADSAGPSAPSHAPSQDKPSADAAQPSAAEAKASRPVRRRHKPRTEKSRPVSVNDPAGASATETHHMPSDSQPHVGDAFLASSLVPWRVDAPEFVPHVALQDEAVLACGPAHVAMPGSTQSKKNKRNKPQQQQQQRRTRPEAASDDAQGEGKEKRSNRRVEEEEESAKGTYESLPNANDHDKQSKKQGARRQKGPQDNQLKEDKKSTLNMKENISKHNNDKRRKWWKILQEDDPISLEPIGQLRYEPFDLKANDDISVWFDPQILANYLVSSGTFTHPVSRRPITKEDCEALDRHLAACRLKKVGVKEVFEFKERLNDPTERITALREQAAAIMEAVFGGRTRERETGRPENRFQGQQRGFRNDRNVPTGQSANFGSQQRSMAGVGREENFPFLIDDDEDFFPSYGNDARRRVEEVQEDFPQLVGTGYINRPAQPPQYVRRNVSNYVCRLSAEYKERMSIQGVVGCIFFISTAGSKNRKKVCNKDVQALFQTSCNIKWIDDTKLYVLVKEAEEEEVMQRLKTTPFTAKMEGSSVYRLGELTRAIEADGKYEPKDHRGLSVQRLVLPTMGDLRFIVLKLCETFSQSYSEERESLEGEEDDYETWLQARWTGTAAAAASQPPRAEAAGQQPQAPPPPPPPPSSDDLDGQAGAAGAGARVPDRWDESWSDVAKNSSSDPLSSHES